ncbi:Predicted dehydrogenase [Singulisphaera sp. GP187]|uniref:Gfo/Idh/MocA family protein n=1 Tax=Singulisphaera sp. GP187 TaxID=1882752 RepID=UPI000928E4FB|nr:Gfo/Idh/MocA family oxidoreductase [Singulisphaera sp. GP187]SIN72429.1 Predicted dehydrogenase [Singulisphaera sp. GP187]
MHRRRFLQAGSAGVAAFSSVGGLAAEFAGAEPKRVGLIGCGWYGKADLFRLVQVAPVEIVSLCDVDTSMLAGAAEMAAARQTSKKTPRTYADYREMLKEQDLDIVLVATPDHWHPLAMIAAVESGADVYVQKPISVDVAEGQAMLAAARKHKRVVQVGTQRRSTPHIIEARDRIINEDKLGKIGLVEIYCYYHMRAKGNPPDTAPPESLDYEMWTGPAPMRPYNALVHPRRWRSFTEYGNGIVGDMCIHMLDMVRWMLGLGWPKRISSAGGILLDKQSKANIPDTQTATFEFNDLPVIWQHRTWGHAADPKYPWGATFYGDKGTLKVGLQSYDFTPMGQGKPIHGDVVMELDQYPEDRTEKDLETHVAPAIRGHMQDFLKAIGTRGKPVADIEQGYISTASCILANNALRLGRTLAWDEQAGRVVGDDQANALLSRPYRQPWIHP